MIADRRVRLLRHKRMEGKTQETAAAKSGMSVLSARKWQSVPLPSATKLRAQWYTSSPIIALNQVFVEFLFAPYATRYLRRLVSMFKAPPHRKSSRAGHKRICDA